MAELMARAEESDSDPSPDDQSLPKEIARRERLLEKMREARRTLEERARNADKDQGGNGEGQGGSGTAAGGGESTPTAPKPIFYSLAVLKGVHPSNLQGI